MFAWVEMVQDQNGVKEFSYSLGTDMTLDGSIR